MSMFIIDLHEGKVITSDGRPPDPRKINIAMNLLKAQGSPCDRVGPSCTAPAGLGVHDLPPGLVVGQVAENKCSKCGAHYCTACRIQSGCPVCQEEGLPF